MFRRNNSVYFKVYLILAILFPAVSLLLGSLFATHTFAYSASITTSGTINLDISASGNGANVAEDKVTVESTCPLGYTLSIKGPTDTTLYKDGNSSNNTASQMINASNGTKTNPLPIIDNKNTWGYAVGSNITASSNFIGLTSTLTELVNKTTGSSTGGDKLSVFYGASVDHTIEPGQYKLAESTTGANDNVITYYLTTNPACNTYYIRYNDNGANSTTTMGNQEVSSTNQDLTLWASNFKREGYGFAGWNTKSDGTGTKLGPNQTIPASELETFLDNNTTIDNNIQYVDLYAMWIQSEGDIQSWTGCSAMSIGDVTALTDKRDNNTYAVAKLADGKCWMIENLRLGSDIAMLLSPQTTDSNAEFTLGGSGNGLSSWQNAMNSSVINANNVTNTVAVLDNDETGAVDTMTNIYGYGVYYNWYSATAGSGNGSTGEYASVEQSICPAGWHLPNDYTNLNNALSTEGVTSFMIYPNNFVYSGIINSSTGKIEYNGGRYWSSVSATTNGATIFAELRNGSVYPDSSTTRMSGATIRCLASETYIISFNSNGGSGTMDNQTVEVGKTVNLNSNTFTAPTGKEFKGWNTKADGTGTSYTNGQSITDLATVGQTIELFAQWGCPANNICYDSNGVSTPTTMSNQTISTTDTSATLWASNFQNKDYGFAGWSTEPIAITDDVLRAQDIPSGVTIYGPNETISDTGTLNNIRANGLELYAVWLEYNVPDYMQDWATDGWCSELNVGDVIALMDYRDEQTYAVAKLADGQCWMIENLRLDNDALGNTSGSYAEGYNTATFKGLAAPETSWVNDSTVANSLYSTTGANNTFAITGSNLGNRFPRYSNENTANAVSNMTTPEGANIYSYGNYYTWSTAIADTTNYTTANETIPNTSICPSGWHLPYGRDYTTAYGGNTPGGFYYLGDKMGATTNDATSSNKWRSYPNNYIFAGGIYDSNIQIRGIGGFYWTSTVDTEVFSYRLRLSKTEILPGNVGYSNKYSGFPIRCVAN